MRILIIDNHDSFVYNIIGVLRNICKQGAFSETKWSVVLNDDINLNEVGNYDALIISPGPGVPCEAGKMMEVLNRYADSMPILGICLGFQGIAEHFGARLQQLPLPRHGHLSHLHGIDRSDPIMGGLTESSPVVGRYHSWIVDKDTLPNELIATSFDEENHIMSLRHRDFAVFGTQFHPESIISDCGEHILTAFLQVARNVNT